MVFRVAPKQAGLGKVERAWVIIAHKLIAHVGSVAETHRMEDFCDDPSAEATGRRPDWSTGLGCSLETENRIRRELNRGLALEGPRGSRAAPATRST